MEMYLSFTRCIIQKVKNINKKTENINEKIYIYLQTAVSVLQ